MNDKGPPVPRALVVMGVTGAGKTTVGRALADRLGHSFEDADDHHPAANRTKMASGQPLTDEDRAPWLERLAGLLGDAVAGRRAPVVLACSALKRSYRDTLGRSGGVAFLHLQLPPEEAWRRVADRPGHFMPPSLVASQFATLEAGDDALTLDATAPVEEVVAAALERLQPKGSERPPPSS